MEVHHTCYNTSCINPDHLKIVTHRENIADYLEQSGINETCSRGHPRKGNTVLNKNRSGKPPTKLCRICRDARNREYNLTKVR